MTKWQEPRDEIPNPKLQVNSKLKSIRLRSGQVSKLEKGQDRKAGNPRKRGKSKIRVEAGRRSLSVTGILRYGKLFGWFLDIRSLPNGAIV
jgi:hypothetical protein